MNILKKVVLFGCLPVIGFIVFVATMLVLFAETTTEAEERRAKEALLRDPKGIGNDSLQKFVGQAYPYEWVRQFGGQKTLDGTDNSTWVVGNDSLNVSFLVNKADDIVTYATFGSDKAAKHKKDFEANRTKHLAKHFSGLDGSHIELTKYIKSIMNDPSSYRHVSTQYWDRVDHIIVLTEFQGKNAFGGVVRNSVKARCNPNTGAVIEIIN